MKASFSLKVTIVVRIAILFILVALASAIVAMEITKDLLVSMGKKYVLEMLERRKKEVSTQLVTQLRYAQYLAGHEAVIEWLQNPEGRSKAMDVLREIRRIARDIDVFAVSERERLLWVNGELLSRIQKEDEDDSWYWETLRSREYEFNFDHNRKLNSTKLWVNYPVYKGTNYYGVVGTGVQYEQIIQDLTDPSGTQHDALLHDEEGMIKIHKNKKMINATNVVQLYGFKGNEYRKAMKRVRSDSHTIEIFLFMHEDREESVAAVAWLPLVRWYLVTSIPIGEYRFSVITPFLTVQLISLILILLSLWTILQKNVFGPLLKICGHLDRIGKLSYIEEIPALEKNEFGKVVESINAMQTGLKSYSENMKELVQLRTVELENAYNALQYKDDYIKHELAIARKIQMALVPARDKCMRYDSLDIGFRYQAMEDLGGDLFDIIRFGRNGFGFFMIDVCGHGVPASLITAMVKVSFNTHAKWGIDASEVMEQVNREITQLLEGMETYVTACYLSINLEKRTYQYVNAGHPSMMVYKKEYDQLMLAEMKGLFINIKKDVKYEMLSGRISAGDAFYMYTDGIIEAWNHEEEMYGLNRMMGLISKNISKDSQETVDLLFEDVVRFTNNALQNDDQAVLFVKIK